MKNNECEKLNDELEAYQEWRKMQLTYKSIIEAAKIDKKNAEKEIKDAQKELNILINEGPDGVMNRPLLQIANNAESEKSDSGGWESENAHYYFGLTKSEWESLEKSPGTYKNMTVEELADITDGLASGRIKIKGVGPSLIGKLEEQFVKFWASRNVAPVDDTVDTTSDAEPETEGESQETPTESDAKSSPKKKSGKKSKQQRGSDEIHDI